MSSTPTSQYEYNSDDSPATRVVKEPRDWFRSTEKLDPSPVENDGELLVKVKIVNETPLEIVPNM